MFLVLNMEDYDSRNIFITESIRNTVIDNSSFIRILYSTSDIILNGIVLKTPFTNYQINKYFNKWRCNFSNTENSELLQSIKDLEREILKKVCIEYKKPCYKIDEQISHNFIKIFLEETAVENISEHHDILLKISGLWVSEQEYGITYKFLLAN